VTPRLPVAGHREMVLELRLLARGRGRRLVGTVVLLVGSAGAGLVFPLTVGAVVDSVVENTGAGIPAEFWGFLALMAGAVVLTGVFEFAGVVALARVAEAAIADLRERYVASALRLPQSTVESVGVGDVVARASSDVREISESVPGVLPQLASTVFTFALSFGGLLVLNWRFAVALAAGLPAYLMALRWYLRTAPPVYAAHRSAESGRSQQVLTTVQALPTVRAHRLGEQRATLARAATWNLVRWAMRARIVQNRLFGRINAAEALGLLLVLGTGFWLTAAGHVGVGAVTAAALLYFRIIGPVGELLFVMDELQSAAASFARVVGVTRFAGVSTSPPPEGSEFVIRCRAVDFGYVEDHPVVRGVDLAIRRGERVALVGVTGSGKTTLARLIAGSHTPDSGSLELSVPRHDVAYLNQEFHVFSATLRENLTLARPDAGDAELVAALETVGFLAVLPEGLDTRLGEDGHRLTAADAQRLALARLVLADPAVAILDEATAEADSRDAGSLELATARAVAGRTAILIAHRLSQAVGCDRVVVLERGRVVEEGPHADLVAAGGRYAELYRAWSGD